MTGSVRKRKTQKGIKYQVAIEIGVNPQTGKRDRIFKTFTTKREAEAFKADCISEYNKGIFVEPSALTVKALCDEWIKFKSLSLKESTVRGYKVNIESHIDPHIGNILVQKLTARHIQAMVNDMNDNGLSPRTIEYVMSNLNQILNHAVNNDIIFKNPIRGVYKPKKEKKKFDTYTSDELGKLISCAKNTVYEPIIIVEAYTGLRRGEILALRWQDIDFEKKTLSVCQNLVCENSSYIVTTPKTASAVRTMVIPDELVSYLKSYKTSQIRERLKNGSYNDHDLIICKSNGDYINTKTFSNAFARFLEKNNLRHIRFHDMRHTHATLLLNECGANIKAVSDRLGHSKVQTTMDYYISSTTSAQKNAVDKLETQLKTKIG